MTDGWKVIWEKIDFGPNLKNEKLYFSKKEIKELNLKMMQYLPKTITGDLKKIKI